MKKETPIDIKSFIPSDGFIKRCQELIRKEVIPYQYDVLWDRAEGAEKSHVVQNFINAAKALKGEDAGDGFYGMVFQDSDAAKWLEAVGYSLALYPDKELEQKADELIDIIAAAQDEDGYLDTYFTISNREKRWKNLLEGHELYCAGHFMEAAAAYYEGTGKDKLLKVMLKNMEHIYTHFVTEKHEGYPGHPEVELALLKLYRLTKDPHALELARHFIDKRGTDDFYRNEAKARDWTVWGNNAEDGEYQQSHLPVREQSDAVGHAVRAVYLYTAMAELSAICDDKELQSSCERLWESITKRRMYITGGIGSTCIGEAFTVDYDLPNDTVYAESCASCGLMFFASRMMENTPVSKYADVSERAFYNTVLGGMQLDGKRFFYVNPLESVPGISDAAATKRHVKTVRQKWFLCACCPPNIARTVMEFGTMAYGKGEDADYCHMFAAGDVDFGDMKMRCETEYPYGFTVKYVVTEGGGTFAVRIPDWSESFSLSRNGENADYNIKNGYAYLAVKQGDTIELKLDDKARFVYCSDKVPANTGTAAIQRGPLVYCFEDKDNGDVLSIRLDDTKDIELGEPLPELGNAVSLKAAGYRSDSAGELYSFKRPVYTPCTVTAVPYYAWGNRGENKMRVWEPVYNG